MRREDEERLEEQKEYYEQCHSVNCMEECEFCKAEPYCRGTGIGFKKTEKCSGDCKKTIDLQREAHYWVGGIGCMCSRCFKILYRRVANAEKVKPEKDDD